MAILNKVSSLSLSILILAVSAFVNVDSSKLGNISTIQDSISLDGQIANAAQTQIERYNVYGYNVKSLQKRGRRIPFRDIVEELIEWSRGVGGNNDIPQTPSTTKFVSADAAGVSWDDASRACDQMKGKLVWFEGKKTCF
jgi:hypothetical protein